MNRSVRNGLAIAGMAGGLFFLGQAVASASDQVAGGSNAVTQTNSSSSDEGSGSNQNSSESTATNVKKVEVDSTVTGGHGGTNNATVNTGVDNSAPYVVYSSSKYEPGKDEHEKQFSSVTFNSGDVTLTQNANGGSVNGSGNIAVADTSGSQTATATNTVNQSNTSTGDEGKGKDKDKDGSVKASESDNSNTNSNESSSEAKNIHKVEVDSTVTGGDGGTNTADINTGIIGNTFHCDKHATCTFDFHTGNVTLVQNANGGSVNGSGNIGIGAPVPGVCECPKAVAKSDCPNKAAEVKPAVKAALSSAQPKGQLAFTGSDVSLPLTVGLLALVAGLGLTVLGRRREIQTV